MSIASTTTGTFAQSAAHPADRTCSTKLISFHCPAGWSPLSRAQVNSLGSILAQSANGTVKVVAIAGIESVNNKAGRAGIAVLTKMSFTSQFRKKLKGNRKLFIRKFDQTLSKTAAKVLTKGKVSFAGRRADQIQVLLNTEGSQTRDQICIAIARDDKSVDMGIMVAVPSGSWGKYKSAFAGIERSSRFR